MKKVIKKFCYLLFIILVTVSIISCATGGNIDGKFREKREDSITWIISDIGSNRFLIKAVHPEWHISKSGTAELRDNILYVKIFFVNIEFIFSKDYNFFIYKNRKYVKVK